MITLWSVGRVVMHRTRNPANQVFLGAQVQILYTPFCQYVEDQADTWSFFIF